MATKEPPYKRLEEPEANKPEANKPVDKVNGKWHEVMFELMLQPLTDVWGDLRKCDFFSPNVAKFASSTVVATGMMVLFDKFVFAAGGTAEGAEERAVDFQDKLKKDLIKLALYMLGFMFSFVLGLAIAAGTEINIAKHEDKKQNQDAKADKAKSAADAAKKAKDAEEGNALEMIKSLNFDKAQKGFGELNVLREQAARDAVLRQCPEAARAAAEAAEAAKRAREAAEEAERKAGEVREKVNAEGGGEGARARRKSEAEAAARVVEEKRDEASKWDEKATFWKEQVRAILEKKAIEVREEMENEVNMAEMIHAEAKEIVAAVDYEHELALAAVEKAGNEKNPERKKVLEKEANERRKGATDLRYKMEEKEKAIGLQAKLAGDDLRDARNLFKTLDAGAAMKAAAEGAAMKEFDYTKMSDLLKLLYNAKEKCKNALNGKKAMENATWKEVASYELREIERKATRSSDEAGGFADDAARAASDALNYAQSANQARTK